MPKMTRSTAENILARLDTFNRLERKATDEAGWIALAYSCSPAKAKKMIAEARAMLGAK